MKTDILTLKLLNALSACKEGIALVKNNNLEGFPLDRINEVKGDFKGFVEWLKKNLKTQLEYDDNGNMIKKVDPYGDVFQYEYDDNGNMIKKVLPDGNVYLFAYDDNGNMIKEVFPDGDVFQYEYDSNGNMIKRVLPDGAVYQYEYDDKGNKIKEVSTYGDVYQFEYHHYDNGQLKSVSEEGEVVLEIPQF